MRSRGLCAGLSLALALGGAAFAESGRDLDRSLDAAPGGRTYRLHVPPANDTKAPLPLVLVLHGGGGSARGAGPMTGFSDLADEKGFFAVYPNGSGLLPDRLLTWNSGNCCGWARDHRVDDVAFLRRLVVA
ncbi:MAG TPA: hypothetical protein VK780_04055, partial [Thermoanaerobaculia bacterium]|nr:hypothetical protein [Thermoanaerobaculia bacterium]